MARTKAIKEEKDEVLEEILDMYINYSIRNLYRNVTVRDMYNAINNYNKNNLNFEEKSVIIYNELKNMYKIVNEDEEFNRKFKECFIAQFIKGRI